MSKKPISEDMKDFIISEAMLNNIDKNKTEDLQNIINEIARELKEGRN